MPYVITEPCIDVNDKSCVAECPVDCIYEGQRMLYIHPDECIDCKACVAVCPVDAIYYEYDVPTDQQVFIEVNRQFFEDVGVAGGASTVGPAGRDVEFVATRSRVA